MEFRVEEKPNIRLTGFKKHISSAEGKALQRIPLLWEASYSDGTYDKLLSVSDKNPGIIGLCTDYQKDGFTYWLSASSTKDAPSGMEHITVEPGTWAIFECKGALPKAMQNTWKQIYNDWFPTCDYEHADAPEIEYYPEGDRSSSDYKSEIWIPVVPKKPKTAPERREPRGKLYGMLMGGVLGVMLGASAENPAVYLLLGLVIGIAAGSLWDNRKKR